MFKSRSIIVNILLITTLLLIVSSCANRLIKRSRSGRVDRNVSRQHFSSIRKKVALLTFFNESPYGGEDLGIVATEELRRELGRTGEFIIDPLTKKIFGSSKEVYAGGGVKLAQLARKAKVAGVNFVLLGRVIEARIREKTDEIGLVRETKSYTESKVEVRMFDVNSGRELLIETVRGY
ncbi:MAG: hypothetical protein HN730_13615, partial [Bdellovibrionales bacterium]|nr:hypothetical protein [Bdellovibrionales bacterium]